MGMYADYHPNQTRVVAWRDGRPVPLDGCERAHWQATRTTHAAAAVQRCVDADEVIVYRPAFDPVARRWTLEEVGRATR
jgi:hypothetical protein